MHEILHVLLHAFLDSLNLLPFLFLIYLLMEFLEHKAGDKVKSAIAKGGRIGPLWGAALGLVPQCGFSAATAGLFAGRVVSAGTLLAVFLATSDEMLPIFIESGMGPRVIFTVLGIKLAVALVAGFSLDLALRDKRTSMSVSDLCEQEGCHCERGIFRSAVHHTLQIFLFILIINIALGTLLAFADVTAIKAAVARIPFLEVLFAALLGLVPNCAASVAVATLYAEGILSAGAMLAGLLTGAGAGLLVLFRTNRYVRQNMLLLGVLLAVGIAVGLLMDLTGLGAALGL